jgi:hypothetical protein
MRMSGNVGKQRRRNVIAAVYFGRQIGAAAFQRGAFVDRGLDQAAILSCCALLTDRAEVAAFFQRIAHLGGAVHRLDERGGFGLALARDEDARGQMQLCPV